jgi:hypothetical protein
MDTVALHDLAPWFWVLTLGCIVGAYGRDYRHAPSGRACLHQKIAAQYFVK